MGRDGPGRLERWPGGPASMGVASGVALWTSFPPVGWFWLGWFALAPLFLLAGDGPAPPRAYLGAWLGGLTFWLLAIEWLRVTSPTSWVAWLTLAAILSAWWPVALALIREAGRLGVPALVAGPVVWVGLEYLRSFLLTGFPWYFLAHGQYRQLYLTQVADFSGAYGLSLVMAMANALWADLLARRAGIGRPLWPVARCSVVGLVVAGTVAYGAYRLGTARFRPGPKVVLLQSALSQPEKTTLGADRVVALYEGLTSRALAGGFRPDVVIWPETSYPFACVQVAPGLGEREFERQARMWGAGESAGGWRDKGIDVEADLRDRAGRLGSSLLVGGFLYDFGPEGTSKSNAAVLVGPGGVGPQAYRKRKLVPFGEYVPLAESYPPIMVLSPHFGKEPPRLSPGPGPAWFELGAWRLAPAICFEDSIPWAIRASFAGAPGGRDPDVAVVVSNDGWFLGTSEQRMHLAISTFRCVENRVPMARASNGGVSAVVDGDGRVVVEVPEGREGFLATTVPLDDRSSAYSAWGDWLGGACLAASAASGLGAVLRASRRRARGRGRPGPPSRPNSAANPVQ